jgi:hypothetical protein
LQPLCLGREPKARVATHCDFSMLFFGTVISQAPWFFNLVFYQYGFFGFSRIVFFWHYFFSIVFSQAWCFLGSTSNVALYASF